MSEIELNAAEMGKLSSLERTVMALDKVGGRESYQLLTPDELAGLPPSQWRIKNILPKIGLAAIFGPSGSSKSFLALDMAIAIDSGEAWFNFRTHKGRVIYCALEGESGIQKRVAAYKAAQGVECTNLRFMIQPFSLLNHREVSALSKAITGIGGADVIILDTLNRATPGADENSSQDMGHIIASAKELQTLLGCLVILVHHTGKDTSRGLRGHSSLHAALDAAIEVSNDNGIRQWRLAKSKDGEDGVTYSYRLECVDLGKDADGDIITSCVIVPEADTSKAIKRVLPPKSGNQKIIWDALQRIFHDDGLAGTPSDAPNGIPRGRPCIRLDAAITQTRSQLVVDEKRRTERAQSAITGLINRGLLTLKDGWIWQT